MENHEKDKYHLAEEAQQAAMANYSEEAQAEPAAQQLGSFSEVNALANSLRDGGGMTWYEDSRTAKKAKMDAYE